MQTDIATRVQKHREALRAAGLRPLQIWVPDTRTRSFAAESGRQARRVAQADARDEDLLQLLDDTLADVGGWKA